MTQMKKTNIFKYLFARNYFKSKSVMPLFILLSAILAVNLIMVLLFTDANEQHVTIKYNSYGAGSQTRGQGYHHYTFGLFALISYLSVVALSIKTFNIRKSLAVLQLYLGIIVLTMLLVVSRAVMTA